MGYQSRPMTAYIPIMIGVLLVTPCSFSPNLNCTKPTSSCPTPDQWSERGKLFNCPGNKNYICLMAPGNELREGCMFNSRIEAGRTGCPYTKQCDSRTGQPVLVTHNYYLSCPPDLDGCPPRNHTGYSIFQICNYPRCQGRNTSEESSVSPDEVTGTQTTIVTEEILQYQNWTLIILCIALGLFTSFIVICIVFKEKVWKKQCWRRHTHPASSDDSESAQTLLLRHMREETSQLSHNKPYPEPVSNISDQDSQLHNAASNGDIERVKELIYANANVNARGFFLVTPLHETASNGHSEIMRILIIAKADVNAKDWYQETPLHKAIKTGRIDIVKILIEAKADVNAKDEYQGTPLHKATEKGRIDIVKILIEAKANVNTTGKYQDTPLHKATENGRIDIVKILIGAKADVNAKDEYQDTPLHRATGNGRIDIVNILIDAKAGVNVKDMYQDTPLHKATRNGRIDIVKALINAKADTNAKDKCQDTPLHIAASNGHSDIVKILNDAKADVNVKDSNRDTPLHIAALNGHMDTVKKLIDAGADVNAKNRHQDTPLHKATENGRIDIVKALIDAKADVKAKDNDTPLHRAAQNGHSDTVKMLIDAKADVNAVGRCQCTPLHMAASNGHSDIVKILTDAKANVNARGSYQHTPLHMAVSNGHIDAVKMLFNAKADVNAKDSDQDTPLHKAASNGHSNLVKMLIDAQAEVNAKGCNEKTPLHLAVESEKTCIIKNLLDEGADVNAEDKNKKTPLSLAEDCGKPDIIKEFPDVILNQNNTNNKTPLSLAENCGKADIRKELPDLVNDNEKKKSEILFHVQLLKKHRYCPDSEDFIVEEARKHFNILNMMICTEYGGEERLVLIGYKSPQDEFRCEQTDFHGITVVIKNLYDVDKTPFKVAHHFSRSKHEIDVDLIKCVISENADRLWKEHSNLSIITGDKLKLVSGNIQPQQCIVLYCLSKGFIPLGEKMFPKQLSCSKGGKVAVDVREGIFSLGPSLRGKTLSWNDTLCMGCNIGREDMSAFGSLGLFIRQNGQREPLWFLTCCHVLFDCIREGQFRYDRSNNKILHTVLQPYTDAFCSRDVMRCGVIERAVFQPNVDPVSVDAALVLITDRAPSTGYFAIKDKQQEEEAGMKESPIFNSGEISESIKDTDRFNPVIKSGTSTGLTTSQFGLDGMQCRLFDGMRLGSKNSAPLVMKGQYEIEAKGSDNPFFTKGDSGSAVFMMDANCKLKCIGLAIGNTSYGTTAVTPIGEILKKLNLRNADVAKF